MNGPKIAARHSSDRWSMLSLVTYAATSFTGTGRMDAGAAVRCVVFFFQAEDGIRDDLVTGVQTCALPIFTDARGPAVGPGAAEAHLSGRHRLRLHGPLLAVRRYGSHCARSRGRAVR